MPLDEDGLLDVDGLLKLSLPLLPEPLVPELPDEPDRPEELPDEEPELLSPVVEPLDAPLEREGVVELLPELASLPAVGRAELPVVSVVLPLWAKAMPAAPIMDTRTASRSFFMVSPCKKWLSLQQALKVSR